MEGNTNVAFLRSIFKNTEYLEIMNIKKYILKYRKKKLERKNDQTQVRRPLWGDLQRRLAWSHDPSPNLA